MNTPNIPTSVLLPESLRNDFPILAESVQNGHALIFLDNAASTQRPSQVIDAISRVYQHDYANVHRGIHTLSERSTELYEQAREKVQSLINAEHAHEIIFTQGATASINLVARSWGDANLRPGDEVLATVMEHHSNLVPWQQAVERTGARLRHVPLTDDGRLDMAAFDRLLNERTKLVAVTSVSNTLGTVNRSARLSPGRTRPVRWCWSTQHKAFRTCRPTYGPGTPIFWPSADTRCSAPRAWASCTAKKRCSRRCRRFSAGAA